MLKTPMQCESIASACGSRIVNGMQLALPSSTVPVKFHYSNADSHSFMREA